MTRLTSRDPALNAAGVPHPGHAVPAPALEPWVLPREVLERAARAFTGKVAASSDDLLQMNQAARILLGPVLAHIDKRPEYVQAARSSVNDADSDYYRWQGHMEARRQLAGALSLSVPYERGEHAVPATGAGS